MQNYFLTGSKAYYHENCDFDFDSRMHNVRFVYKKREKQFNELVKSVISDDVLVHVLSYDEKLDAQAITTTSDELIPNKKHSTVIRDYLISYDNNLYILRTIFKDDLGKTKAHSFFDT